MLQTTSDFFTPALNFNSASFVPTFTPTVETMAYTPCCQHIDVNGVCHAGRNCRSKKAAFSFKPEKINSVKELPRPV
jgi:hypothetical protein